MPSPENTQPAHYQFQPKADISFIAECKKNLHLIIHSRIHCTQKKISISHPMVNVGYTHLTDFMMNGKHIRPHCVWAGWLIASHSARDTLAAQQLAHLGAACEFLHACALIHDDVIDQSSTRRNQPTIHEIYNRYSTQYASSPDDFTAQHSSHEFSPDHTPSTIDYSHHTHFGYSMAILIGDLALTMANHEFSTLNQHDNTLWDTWHTMSYEVLTGQILDVSLSSNIIADSTIPTLVNSLKTSSYTFMRPLQLGALLAGASPSIIDSVLEIGSCLGAAFQLQDDLLGTFSPTQHMGKFQGDDIISGKSTVLLAESYKIANKNSDPQILEFLRTSVGHVRDQDHLHAIISIIEQLGAKAVVEEKISSYFTQALYLLEQLACLPHTHPDGIEYMRNLITDLSQRSA